MNSPVQVIERLSLVAPLGLRFWDAVANACVGSGLVVSAYATGRPNRRVQATVNSVGIYGFTHLPGLRDLENGAGDTDYWAELPAPKSFVVEIEDLEGRFLPCSILATAPLKGLFAFQCGSPLAPFPPPVETVPLFSSAARSVPSGMAVIRAELWDAQRDQPAAWALVEAQPPSQAPVQGMADAKGQVVLLFPYPPPTRPPVGSPLGSPLLASIKPLWQQSWPIRLAAFYTPQPTVPSVPDLAPNLCQALLQAPATLWRTLSPLQVLDQSTLDYGKELILRTEGSTGVQLSRLYITPLGSPP